MASKPGLAPTPSPIPQHIASREEQSFPQTIRPSRALFEAENAQSRAMTQALAERMGALAEELENEPIDAVFRRLSEERNQVQSGTAAEAAYAWPWLARMHEDLTQRAKGTPEEGPAWLALSRTYRQAGWPRASVDAFDRYIDAVGEAARAKAVEAGKSPAEIALAEQTAKADAYHAEVLAARGERDHAAALELAGRMLVKYPTSARAYEGQLVAARIYLANRQPDEVIACYRTILDHCPDATYARQAGMSYIRLLQRAKRADEAIEACQTLRERFVDDEFRQFAMLREGELLRDKGQRHYPRALALFRTLCDIQPDSPYAKQAEQGIRQLTRNVMFDMMKSDILGN